MLIKPGLQLFSNQYAKNKFMKRSKSTQKIKANFKDQEEEDNKGIAFSITLIHFSTSLKAISIKDNNLRSITLAHILVY